MTMSFFKRLSLTLPPVTLSAYSGVVGENAANPETTVNSQAPARAPNVLFILADDMGYGQLGITGHSTA